MFYAKIINRQTPMKRYCDCSSICQTMFLRHAICFLSYAFKFVVSVLLCTFTRRFFSIDATIVLNICFNPIFYYVALPEIEEENQPYQGKCKTEQKRLELLNNRVNTTERKKASLQLISFARINFLILNRRPQSWDMS